MKVDGIEPVGTYKTGSELFKEEFTFILQFNVHSFLQDYIPDGHRPKFTTAYAAILDGTVEEVYAGRSLYLTSEFCKVYDSRIQLTKEQWKAAVHSRRK